MKASQTKIASMEVENLLGDFHPLIDQMGSPGGLKLAGSVNASLRLDHVGNFADLEKFLKNYMAQLLAPVELPLIFKAHGHASRNEFCELISLDQQVAREARLEVFATASQRIGQFQLQRLRPLRDQRGLQRYIRAVDSGEANAWHTLVYGITLASFSLPLRQGLQNYGQQTLSGFIRSANRTLHAEEKNCEFLLQELSAELPAILDQLLADSFSIQPPGTSL